MTKFRKPLIVGLRSTGSGDEEAQLAFLMIFLTFLLTSNCVLKTYISIINLMSDRWLLKENLPDYLQNIVILSFPISLVIGPNFQWQTRKS